MIKLGSRLIYVNAHGRKKKIQKKIAKLRDPTISLLSVLPFSLFTFKCQIRNNIEAIAQRRSIIYHIYTIYMHDIMRYICIWAESPPELSLAEVSCHVCGLLMSASAATEAQEAAKTRERKMKRDEDGDDDDAARGGSPRLALSPLKCVVMIGRQ